MRLLARAKGVRVSLQVCFELDGDGFHAYAPALKGCHVGGATLEEAHSAIREAAQLYLRSLIKHGDPIPVGCAEHPTAVRASPAKSMNPLPSIPMTVCETPSAESIDLTVAVPA